MIERMRVLMEITIYASLYPALRSLSPSQIYQIGTKMKATAPALIFITDTSWNTIPATASQYTIALPIPT